jgi:hypothetical protein
MGHTSQKDLNEKIKKARKKVEVGGLYYHYKNSDRHYVVEFVGLLENTEGACVGYRSLYGKGILWVRTIEDFTSRVKYNGKTTSRFKKMG